MEPFVDFGLFEFLAAVGLAAVSRTIYRRRVLGIAFLAVTIAAPIGLLVFASDTTQRWLAVACLATGLVNAAVLAAVLQSGNVPQLKVKLPFRRKSGSREQAHGGLT